MDIDRRRTLPRFERSLYAWMRSRRSRLHAAEHHATLGTVILYPDCFTVYNEPRVGRAAVEVLESMGYRVVLPALGCCGRSMISVGMLREAGRTCTASARGLIDVMRRQRAGAVVGCEPSCVSAIIDDWQDFDMDVPQSELAMLKERTFAVEEFVARQAMASDEAGAQAAGAFEPLANTRDPAPPVLLHGHCHQKALWAADALELLLRERLGDRLKVLDSGCCGMAGSFGYSTKRYDISMQVGELVLLPAVRAQPDAVVLAAGTSCRHQIHDAVSRRALHPIEFLAADRDIDAKRPHICRTSTISPNRS